MSSLPWVATRNENLPRVAWVENELWLEYASGSVYRFDGVPRRFYNSLLEAQNPNRFIERHVRRRFDFERFPAGAPA